MADRLRVMHSFCVVLCCVVLSFPSLDDFHGRCLSQSNTHTRHRHHHRCCRRCLAHVVSDVLRDQSNPNKFIFYEVYESVDAISYHKEQDHYKAWADFKESGGVVSSESHKLDGEFMT